MRSLTKKKEPAPHCRANRKRVLGDTEEWEKRQDEGVGEHKYSKKRATHKPTRCDRKTAISVACDVKAGDVIGDHNSTGP